MSRLKPRNPDHFFMEKTLRELMDHPLAWPYIHPVSLEDAPDYYQVITKPMGTKFTCLLSLSLKTNKTRCRSEDCGTQVNRRRIFWR